MLDRLPPEILRIIIECLNDQIYTKHICQVSKTLYEKCIPYIYDNINFQVYTDLPHEDFSSDQAQPFEFLQPGSELIGNLGSVAKLHITGCSSREPYHCPHDDWAGEACFQAFEEKLLPLIENLRSTNLKEFSWMLGCCVPERIFEHLAQKQNGLQALRLVTSSSCRPKRTWEQTLDLSKFKSLRVLQWQDFSTDGHFDALHGALEANAEHLVNIRLDKCKDFYAERILTLSEGQETVKFPALKSLFLSSMAFDEYLSEMIYAFNICSLTSLTLRQCDGTIHFLEEIMNSGHEVSLTALEIENTDTPGMLATVNWFLTRCHGLKDLFVSTLASHDQDQASMTFLNTLYDHRSTLRRLVLHQKYDTGIFPGDRDKLHDFTSISFEEQDFLHLESNRGIYSELKLECIGLSMATDLARRFLPSLESNHTLKILHLRRSRRDWRYTVPFIDTILRWHKNPTEPCPLKKAREPLEERLEEVYQRVPFDEERAASLHYRLQLMNEGYELAKSNLDEVFDFAEWVFGPEGIQCLKLLAFGDFTDGEVGMLQDNNIILCRDETGGKAFRAIRKSDGKLQALVKDNMDFLASCFK